MEVFVKSGALLLLGEIPHFSYLRRQTTLSILALMNIHEVKLCQMKTTEIVIGQL